MPPELRRDRLESYDYELPPERIAQEPAARRERSRLMVVPRGATGTRFETARFDALPRWLRRGDVLVLNDARVFPARLRFRRGGRGNGEVLLLRPESAGDATLWEALVRPARWARRALARGERTALEARAEVAPEATGGAAFELVEELDEGRFLLRLCRGDRALDESASIELCEELGETPLPPYIRRDAARPDDRERYQTVYASVPCAAAAPTAGLHFTGELLEEIRDHGVDIVTLTHQVGLGTFQPLRQDDLRAARLHAEWTRIDAPQGEKILAARGEGRRVIAVGTTTVRSLESLARSERRLPFVARTDLFIRAGFEFRVVDGLVTNFHLPRSSLLVLVSALAGYETIRAAYRQAIDDGFRFYSYGDAMLITDDGEAKP